MASDASNDGHKAKPLGPMFDPSGFPCVGAIGFEPTTPTVSKLRGAQDTDESPLIQQDGQQSEAPGAGSGTQDHGHDHGQHGGPSPARPVPDNDVVSHAETHRTRVLAWLRTEHPEIFTEDDRGSAGARERAYWHLGYAMALGDLLRALGGTDDRSSDARATTEGTAHAAETSHADAHGLASPTKALGKSRDGARAAKGARS